MDKEMKTKYIESLTGKNMLMQPVKINVASLHIDMEADGVA